MVLQYFLEVVLLYNDSYGPSQLKNKSLHTVSGINGLQAKKTMKILLVKISTFSLILCLVWERIYDALLRCIQ